MRRAKRVINNTFLFLTLFSLLVGIYTVTSQSSIFNRPQKQQIVAENNPVLVPVTQNQPTNNAQSAPLVQASSVLGASSGSCGQAWKWPCDVSQLRGHFVNGTLIGQAGKTIEFSEVLFKKEPPGLELSAGVSTKVTITDKNGTPTDTRDDTEESFGLCLAGSGEYQSLAMINLSQPLLPDLLAGYKLSVQPVEGDEYATIDWNWFNSLKPKDFEKFGSISGDDLENTLRTMATFNIISPSNNFGPDFASYVLSKVRLQAPGKPVDFVKEFEEDKGVESTTMQALIENNEDHPGVKNEFREKMKDKGLAGIIVPGNSYIGALVFQPKDNLVKPVRQSGATIATKELYNMFAAAPQTNTEDLKKNDRLKVASPTQNSNTVLSISDTTLQDEFERSTIIDAIFGGVYYIPASNIAAAGKISMLSYDPNKLNTSKYMCDFGKGNCPIVKAVSSCSGAFSASVSIRLRQIVLSATNDTNQYSGTTTKDDVARSQVRAGNMFTRKDKSPLGALEKASIEEILSITDKAAPSCRAIVDSRLSSVARLTPLEQASLKKTYEEKAFRTQSMLVSSINAKFETFVNHKRDPAVMAAIRAIIPWFFANEKDPEWAVIKTSGQSVKPALISFDSHILVPGAQATLPGSENSIKMQENIDAFLSKQNVEKMNDAKVCCNTAGEYWLCSDSGTILPKSF